MEKKPEATRYGIGEWYGKRIDRLTTEERARNATLKGINKAPCPFRPADEGCNDGLRISEIVLTTLESSVEGLTAGVPVSRDEFEDALRKTIIGKKGKAVRLS